MLNSILSLGASIAKGFAAIAAWFKTKQDQDAGRAAAIGEANEKGLGSIRAATDAATGTKTSDEEIGRDPNNLDR